MSFPFLVSGLLDGQRQAEAPLLLDAIDLVAVGSDRPILEGVTEDSADGHDGRRERWRREDGWRRWIDGLEAESFQQVPEQHHDRRTDHNGSYPDPEVHDVVAVSHEVEMREMLHVMHVRCHCYFPSLSTVGQHHRRAVTCGDAIAR